MKIRTKFVSNSSSSSFTIQVKDGKELTSEMLFIVFTAEKGSIWYPIAESMVKILFREATEYTLEGYGEEQYGSNWKREIEQDERELFDNEMTVYKGSVSDEDYDEIGTQALVAFDLDYEDDNLILKKRAFY